MRNVLSAIVLAMGLIAMLHSWNFIALLFCLLISYAIWDGDKKKA